MVLGPGPRSAQPCFCATKNEGVTLDTAHNMDHRWVSGFHFFGSKLIIIPGWVCYQSYQLSQSDYTAQGQNG